MAQAEARARFEAQAAALADRLAMAEQAQRKSVSDLDTVQAELAAAQRRAERAEAEAALVRQLLAELRLAPPERDGGRRRRKAGSRAPNEQPSDKPGEQLGDNQGAPTASLTPEDGSESSDRSDSSDDSKD